MIKWNEFLLFLTSPNAISWYLVRAFHSAHCFWLKGSGKSFPKFETKLNIGSCVRCSFLCSRHKHTVSLDTITPLTVHQMSLYFLRDCGTSVISQRNAGSATLKSPVYFRTHLVETEYIYNRFLFILKINCLILVTPS